VGYNNGVGRQAPSFILPAADGGEIDLGDYRGDWFPVLVFVPAQSPGVERELAGLSSAAGTFWGLRGQLLGICDASLEETRALAWPSSTRSARSCADPSAPARARISSIDPPAGNTRWAMPIEGVTPDDHRSDHVQRS
jgi:alkyl hydroperoxide reductase subunit AhpC